MSAGRRPSVRSLPNRAQRSNRFEQIRQPLRLCRERVQLLADLGAKNAELEQTLEHLRGAQHDLVREASVRAHLQRYVSPRLVNLASARAPAAAMKSVKVLRLFSRLPSRYQRRPLSLPPRTCAIA